MFARRSFTPIFLAVLGWTAARSPAQVPPAGPTPEQQELVAQMQQAQQQMVQNMQAKGINPQEFFQQMRTQMQDGSFDPADFQKMLVDKGLIDPQLASQIQGTMKRAVTAGIRQQLKVTDDEWAVLQPKIQRVLDAMASVGPSDRGGGRLGGMAGFMQGNAADGEVAKALAELRAAVKNPATDPDAIVAKLAAWRAARAQAKADLTAAQKDLTGVLTIRQEAILTQAGLL